MDRFYRFLYLDFSFEDDGKEKNKINCINLEKEVELEKLIDESN